MVCRIKIKKDLLKLMMTCRRNFVPGASYFFTVILFDSLKEWLYSSFYRSVSRREYPLDWTGDGSCEDGGFGE